MLFLALFALETATTINYYVYLKNANTRVRKGPGSKHKVACILTTPTYPLKVIAEYENWRHVADHKGPVGWLHKTFLSRKKRFGLTLQECTLTKKETGQPIARLPVDMVVELVSAQQNHWFVIVKDPTQKNKVLTGLLPQQAIWGE